MKENEKNPQQQPEREQELQRNYMLIFKTYYGGLLGWHITSSLPSEEIPHQIETAAQEWLLSPDGREYVDKEDITDWGMDYANALMNVPHEILAKHNIHLKQSVYEIVELDPDENVLPDELRQKPENE